MVMVRQSTQSRSPEYLQNSPPPRLSTKNPNLSSRSRREDIFRGGAGGCRDWNSDRDWRAAAASHPCQFVKATVHQARGQCPLEEASEGREGA